MRNSQCISKHFNTASVMLYQYSGFPGNEQRSEVFFVQSVFSDRQIKNTGLEKYFLKPSEKCIA